MTIKNETHLVVMAGGSGQRFWPWSNKKIPKQFQDFLNTGESLLQTTLKRYEHFILTDHIWIVTNFTYKSIIKQQLPWLEDQQILCEPISKNTAPCIAYACYEINKIHPKATLIITPADHIIQKEDIFLQATEDALRFKAPYLALTLIGAPCNKPETGYGYITFNKEYTGVIKPIIGFREKPTLKEAENYIKQPNYVWNTGIFIGRLKSFIKNFKTYLPEVWNIFEQKDSFSTEKESASVSMKDLYNTLPAISFDQGVLEKAKQVYVVICEDFGWCDLGTWNALYDHLEKDNNNNACQGQVITLETSNCLIKNGGQQLIATYGLQDLVIVQQQNTLVICPRSEVQNLKKLVKKLQEEEYEEFL